MSINKSEQALRLVSGAEIQNEEDEIITTAVFEALNQLQNTDIVEIQKGAIFTQKLLKQKRNPILIAIVRDNTFGRNNPLTSIIDTSVIKRGQMYKRRALAIYAPALFSIHSGEILHADAVESLEYDLANTVVLLPILQADLDKLSLQHPLVDSLRSINKFALEKQREYLYTVEKKQGSSISSIMFLHDDPRQTQDETELLLRMEPTAYYTDTSIFRVREVAHRLLSSRNDPNINVKLLEDLISPSPSWNLLRKFVYTRTYESQERYDILTSPDMFPEISHYYQGIADDPEKELRESSPEIRADMAAKYILYRKMGLDLDI